MRNAPQVLDLQRAFLKNQKTERLIHTRGGWKRVFTYAEVLGAL